MIVWVPDLYLDDICLVFFVLFSDRQEFRISVNSVWELLDYILEFVNLLCFKRNFKIIVVVVVWFGLMFILLILWFYACFDKSIVNKGNYGDFVAGFGYFYGDKKWWNACKIKDLSKSLPKWFLVEFDNFDEFLLRIEFFELIREWNWYALLDNRTFVL